MWTSSRVQKEPRGTCSGLSPDCKQVQETQEAREIQGRARNQNERTRKEKKLKNVQLRISHREKISARGEPKKKHFPQEELKKETQTKFQKGCV